MCLLSQASIEETPGGPLTTRQQQQPEDAPLKEGGPPLYVSAAKGPPHYMLPLYPNAWPHQEASNDDILLSPSSSTVSVS